MNNPLHQHESHWPVVLIVVRPLKTQMRHVGKKTRPCVVNVIMNKTPTNTKERLPAPGEHTFVPENQA